MTARAAGAWLLSAALTVAAFAVAHQLWERVPGWTRGTPASAYKELVSVLAIFAALSVLEVVFNFVRNRISKHRS